MVQSVSRSDLARIYRSYPDNLCLYTDCNLGFLALCLRQLKAEQMRHRFLPFPCLRLVRSGTASGESRILSAGTSALVLIPERAHH
jgi:hypothetical protein